MKTDRQNEKMEGEGMKPIWTPSEDSISRTHLLRFMDHYYAALARGDYASMHRESLTDPARFWSSVWDYCGVEGDKGTHFYRPAADMKSAKFLPDAQLNFAENLLRKDDESDAIIAWGEGVTVRRISWRQLNQQVKAFAGWLKTQGIKPGDRVAVVMPNLPETIIAMLGATAIGASFASASPDFGEQGILDRFGQIAPRILISVDGYRYNGKLIDIRDKIISVVDQIPSIEHVVSVPYMQLSKSPGYIAWDDIVCGASDPNFVFERFAFDHPLYILFSSGTTGQPKCIVHRAGGVLLQHLKEHQLQSNIFAGDRVFYFTTCGWMMWNWLASALASAATLVLYDGSPFYPDGHVLFDYLAQEKVTFFGTSAKYIDAVKKAGLRPIETHDLSSVRTIASTGSPLVSESFDFVYSAIKKDVHLASISGGTDIVSCFVGANPFGNVYGGEIQAPGLGMAVEIWNVDGQAIVEERGELVCTHPFPSMPIGFWNDPDQKRYTDAYFAKYPHVWCHGDFALQTENGGYIILGRSDATLNPGGVRIGTAEIYRLVEQLDEVVESVVIGQEWDGDVRIVLFVILAEGIALTDGLQNKIKTCIREGSTPRHVPAKIIAVSDIPRTKSGKITELAIRDIIHGRAIENTEALANPQSLEIFKSMDALKT